VIYFLDTSALVKRYVEEAGSEKVRQLLRRRVEIAVARITQAEAFAAIARATRKNEITADERDRAFGSLAEDMGSARIIEIRRAIVQAVRDLVIRWPLRGYDAVQLACALRLRAEGAAVDVWCSDDDLANAARGEGMRATVV
jgi:predicted nucleic acid-binding protein